MRPQPWRISFVPGSHFDLGWCGSIGEANVTFSVPIEVAFETNALEDNQAPLAVEGKSLTLQLRAHGIHTVRIIMED